MHSALFAKSSTRLFALHKTFPNRTPHLSYLFDMQLTKASFEQLDSIAKLWYRSNLTSVSRLFIYLFQGGNNRHFTVLELSDSAEYLPPAIAAAVLDKLREEAALPVFLALARLSQAVLASDPPPQVSDTPPNAFLSRNPTNKFNQSYESWLSSPIPSPEQLAQLQSMLAHSAHSAHTLPPLSIHIFRPSCDLYFPVWIIVELGHTRWYMSQPSFRVCAMTTRVA
jgi:hypothetical protein